MDAKSEAVDDYLEALSADQRAALQSVRETIRSVAPDAAESISYGIPTFKYKKRPLIHFGAAKNHCAIYGAVVAETDKEQLKEYDTSKGTIRFHPEKPLPEELIKSFVKRRIDQIEAGVGGYKKKAATSR